jgi:hypothetical protein
MTMKSLWSIVKNAAHLLCNLDCQRPDKESRTMVPQSISQGATFRRIEHKGGLRLLTRLRSKAQGLRGMDEVQWKRHE